MTPGYLDLHFEEVDPARLAERSVDGKRELRVAGGALPAEHARVLRMVFRTGRIGPHALSVDVAREIRQPRPGVAVDGDADSSWVATPGVSTFDAVIPSGEAGVTIRWFEPAEGARIVRLGEAQLDTGFVDEPGRPTNLWYPAGANTSLDAYLAAKANIEADPARSEIQKRAARFWLSLDLCTSLADPAKDGPGVAKALEVDAELIAVDPVQRKWLSGVLMQRWMTRANCAAAGVPFELVFYEVPGDARDLAIEVARLFQQLLAREFPTVDAAASEAIVEFACGRLRRPGVGERLNVEPNSMAMASFAEVMDLASVTDGNTPHKKLKARDKLRRLFVAMIQPFTEIYAPRPPQKGDHLESGYRYQNLGLKPGQDVGGDWPGEKLQAHVDTIAALPADELHARWGAALVSGLRDEPSVIQAGRWAQHHPAPHDAAAQRQARALIKRELGAEEDGAS